MGRRIGDCDLVKGGMMFIAEGVGKLPLNLWLSPRFVQIFIIAVGIALFRSGVFSPRHFKLRRKGMDLLLEGKPAEAEKCYRAALDLGAKVPVPDRVRLLVCLGDSLMDQGRYVEAQQYLAQALQLVDPTGSGQTSMCDVLLAQKASPEKAIEMADEAARLHERGSASLSFGDRWAAVSKDLFDARTWARKARALLMLDRRAEARQAMDRALRILEMTKPELQKANPTVSPVARLLLGNRLRRMKDLTISDTSWQIGLALVALGDTDKAAEQFRNVRDTDPMGKYRNLAQKELDRLGYSSASLR